MQQITQDTAARAATSLTRLLPRIEARFKAHSEAAEWDAYIKRLRRHFPRLFEQLFTLYGSHYDFFYHLEGVIASATELWQQRPAELKALDALRETDPCWYQSNRMVGAMCYVDLFAGDLQGLRERIPYLTELGITYLHLMPLFKAPRGDNDGGYAVSSYREVNPDLGTMAELAELAAELRHRGISLTLDFEFNHTSDEHEWAQRALAGDPEYQAYYRLFPDRRLPDAYEATMPEVFTEDHPGAFTFLAASKLMGEGYGFGGEGDATSSAAVAMMRELAGSANFTEMFTMDFAHNAVLMMHMGEGNWTMARKDEPIWALRSTLGLVDLRVAPVLLAFSLEPGDVTLVSLVTGPGGRFKLVATEGQVVDFPYVADMGRPHYKFAPAAPLADFLTRYSLAGGSHHQALVYGHWAGTVEKIATLLGVDYARI